MNSKVMMLDRRRALQGMAAVGAGALLPPATQQGRPASA
jgi:hypothetical protein